VGGDRRIAADLVGFYGVEGVEGEFVGEDIGIGEVVR
jgi:hypothetical protein